MEITPRIVATYEDLSPLALRFLEFALEHPEGRRDFMSREQDLPEWIRRYTYPLQSWPTLVGTRKLAELERATVGITRLVKEVPERVFDRDPEKLAEFYGFENQWLAAMLMESPNGIEGALARVDCIDTEDGLLAVEVNLGAYLGGWQLRFWNEVFRNNPLVADFLAKEQVAPVFRDPFRLLFEHLIGDSRRRGISDAGEMNVTFALDPSQYAIARPAGDALDALYREVLEEHGEGLEGHLRMARYPDDVTAHGIDVFHEGRRVHALVEYSSTFTPRSIYRSFKAERLSLYNGPLSHWLGDKRALALLSRLADSGRFSSEERELIHRHVPWSREVQPGEVTFQGETGELFDLMIARREDLVLKPGSGRRGEDVHVGRYIPPDQWERYAREAVESTGWLVQQHLESRPYLFQHGEAGCEEHQVVWGLFCFGTTYGGGFLRMMPSDGESGVINSARGASEGFVFEV